MRRYPDISTVVTVGFTNCKKKKNVHERWGEGGGVAKTALTQQQTARTYIYTIMMSPLLNEIEAEPLKELIQFMRGVRTNAQLTRRKWTKPAPRYLHIWNWILQYGRSVRSRTSRDLPPPIPPCPLCLLHLSLEMLS